MVYVSRVFLESGGGNDSFSTNLVLKEFIDGNPEGDSNYTSKENATLQSVYDKLKSSYAMMNSYIYMASQNCSEMILSIGKRAQEHAFRIGM